MPEVRTVVKWKRVTCVRHPEQMPVCVSKGMWNGRYTHAKCCHMCSTCKVRVKHTHTHTTPKAHPHDMRSSRAWHARHTRAAHKCLILYYWLVMHQNVSFLCPFHQFKSQGKSVAHAIPNLENWGNHLHDYSRFGVAKYTRIEKDICRTYVLSMSFSFG